MLGGVFMSKVLRLSEKWFRRGLWLVAFLFAAFLIGLGSSVVGDLPKVEAPLQLDDFLERDRAQTLREEIAAAEKAAAAARTGLEQAELQEARAISDRQVARDAFDTWLAARTATQRSDDDPEVMARTHALDALRETEQAARQTVQDYRQQLLDARQQADSGRTALKEMESQAREAMRAQHRYIELRVFLYRLALTLPLLAVAGWLFVRKRKSTYWPFVWGFIYFALFAFFFELVPYLPSYGGYVRSTVGIVVTVLVGRWAIVGLNRYLERQRQAESRPESERRRALGYDVAQGRLAKGVCPSCERPVDLKDGCTDFCPHCGIGLFQPCTHCSARKSAFARYCHRCGGGQDMAADPPADA